jgi:transposase
MPRTHGYTPRGKRCFSVKDWQAKGRTNVIGALLGATLLTASLFECTIDSDVFHAWITQELLPKLPEQTIIVMDNATFHKRQDTQKAITHAGHNIEFMPPYSPDLNPIEHKWAQAKSIRRTTQCTIEQLFQQL